jgi:Zn-dependent protease with chaperone function
MSIAILLPALVAAIAAVVATGAHRRLAPPLAARVIAVTMIAVAVAVVPAVVVLAAAFSTHVPWFGGALSWCRDAFGPHEHVPQWLGVPAVALVGVAAVRLVRVRRLWTRTRCEDSNGVEVLPSADLFAYTLPGAGGHIVVSQGLVDELDDAEFAIVMAHERAHGALRHDRFVVLGAITVALVPVLAPLQRRLRFALERWADETTVDALEVRRDVVARTLATVALSTATVPAGAAGVVGVGVAARVTALLDPPSGGRSAFALGAVGIAAVLGAAVVQTHHLLPLLGALCPG